MNESQKSLLIDDLLSVFGCLKFKTIVGKNGQATYNHESILLIPATSQSGSNLSSQVVTHDDGCQQATKKLDTSH